MSEFILDITIAACHWVYFTGNGKIINSGGKCSLSSKKIPLSLSAQSEESSYVVCGVEILALVRGCSVDNLSSHDGWGPVKEN